MNQKSKRRRLILEILIVVIAVASGLSLAWMSIMRVESPILQLITGVIFTLSIATFVWVLLDPDTQTATQTDGILQLASQMLDCTKHGLTVNAAQQICELLLPATPAIAVAITDRKVILGYAGYNKENNEAGYAIRTTATHETIADGKPRILHRTDDIGLPASSARINAAIVQPLYIGKRIEGTLKFYYRRANQVSKTQESLAHGFAELLSTQMAASALEEQVKLTTSMELKALQAQINPHFLFNTLNTIASLIRTDPVKARLLLRDFAAFYRSTLEDADDLIALERELKQVERYVSFEVARFGEERLQLVVDVDERMMDMQVPSFLIQPLVENAVKHAMKAEGKLVVVITGRIEDDVIVVSISDNGKGMTEETVANMMNAESQTGLGIAVKNVHDRMIGYFGPDSRMEVESKLSVGTTVSFVLDRAIAQGDDDGYFDNDDLRESTVPAIPNPVIN